MSAEERIWSVVVPVKPAAIGKSRLAVPGLDRRDLARAIALDTIAAAARARRVAEIIVVTDDPDVRAAIASMHNEGDRGHADADPAAAPAPAAGSPSLCTESAAAAVRAVADPANGLNGALAAGLDAATGAARAALLGDLPALRAADLDDALGRAHGPAVVADTDGTGTTLLAHAGPGLLAFGPDSFARHVAAGAAPLDVAPGSTLRHDVDTAAQLEAARALGLGPRTAALLAGGDGAR